MYYIPYYVSYLLFEFHKAIGTLFPTTTNNAQFLLSENAERNLHIMYAASSLATPVKYCSF